VISRIFCARVVCFFLEVMVWAYYAIEPHAQPFLVGLCCGVIAVPCAVCSCVGRGISLPPHYANAWVLSPLPFCLVTVKGRCQVKLL
jgi:hypothetical protein